MHKDGVIGDNAYAAVDDDDAFVENLRGDSRFSTNHGLLFL